jgi:hypothetical protein
MKWKRKAEKFYLGEGRKVKSLSAISYWNKTLKSGFLFILQSISRKGEYKKKTEE